jgi:hypothetical protein
MKAKIPTQRRPPDPKTKSGFFGKFTGVKSANASFTDGDSARDALRGSHLQPKSP